MTILSVVILILQVIILAVGILMGYRRGVGKSTVRLGYLTLIAFISFFLGRLIAFAASGKVTGLVVSIVPEDIKTVLTNAPELEVLIANLIGALSAPIVFAILFGLLQLLSLIFFNKLSGSLVRAIYGEEEGPAWSKWAGAGVGLVAGYLVAVALLSPLNMTLQILDSVPDETVTIFEEAFGGYDSADSNTASAVPYGSLASYPVKGPSFCLPTPKFVNNRLTAYTVPGVRELEAPDKKDCATDSVPVVATIIGNALHTYNKTIEKGGEGNDALMNALAIATEDLDSSPTVQQTATSTLRSIGKVLSDGGSVMGLEAPKSEDPIVKEIVDVILVSLSNTTNETAAENAKSLFGTVPDDVRPPVPTEDRHNNVSETDTNPPETDVDQPATGNNTPETDSNAPETDDNVPETDDNKPDNPPAQEKPAASSVANKGLLSAMTRLDKDDPFGSIKEEATADIVNSAITNLVTNAEMSGVLNAVHDYAKQLIIDSGIDILDRVHQPFYDSICGILESSVEENIKNNGTKKDLANAFETIIRSEIANYDFPVDESYIPMLAACAANEFGASEYISNDSANISAGDIMLFFGAASDDIPDWAK